MQKSGLIPLRSSILYPIAFLCIHNITKSWEIWLWSSLELTITGQDSSSSSSSRNKYLRLYGKGFNSNFFTWGLSQGLIAFSWKTSKLIMLDHREQCRFDLKVCCLNIWHNKASRHTTRRGLWVVLQRFIRMITHFNLWPLFPFSFVNQDIAIE